MIGINNLTFTVGAFKLDIPSFKIKKGEFHILLGPTGSGKTLLLEYIVGLLPKASGDIFINGQKANRLAPESRKIAYVPQDLALFPHLTVRKNIEFGLRFKKKQASMVGAHSQAATRAKTSERVNQLIKVTNIGHLLDRYPAKLSGGEKQRVALVRALASEPELLLLDEPLSGLHPSLKLDTWQLLKTLHKELDLTVLMVTHDVDEALALGEVISFISQGKIRQTAKQKEIYYRPKTCEVAQFFGLRNLFKGKVVQIDADFIWLQTPALGRIKVTKTHRENKLQLNDCLYWGIHAEEVTIVKPDRKNIKRENFFTGSLVSHVEVGRFHIYSIQLHNKQTEEVAAFEVNIPEHTTRKLQLTVGQQIDIELKPERLFWVKP